MNKYLMSALSVLIINVVMISGTPWEITCSNGCKMWYSDPRNAAAHAKDYGGWSQTCNTVFFATGANGLGEPASDNKNYESWTYDRPGRGRYGKEIRYKCPPIVLINSTGSPVSFDVTCPRRADKPSGDENFLAIFKNTNEAKLLDCDDGITIKASDKDKAVWLNDSSNEAGCNRKNDSNDQCAEIALERSKTYAITTSDNGYIFKIVK